MSVLPSCYAATVLWARSRDDLAEGAESRCAYFTSSDGNDKSAIILPSLSSSEGLWSHEQPRGVESKLIKCFLHFQVPTRRAIAAAAWRSARTPRAQCI